MHAGIVFVLFLVAVPIVVVAPASAQCPDPDFPVSCNGQCWGCGGNSAFLACCPTVGDPIQCCETGVNTECSNPDTCNPANGQCEPNDEPASTPCPDSDNNTCTTAGCDGNGTCDQAHILTPDSTPCADNDGNACTVAGCNAGGLCDQSHILDTDSPPCTVSGTIDDLSVSVPACSGLSGRVNVTVTLDCPIAGAGPVWLTVTPQGGLGFSNVCDSHGTGTHTLERQYIVSTSPGETIEVTAFLSSDTTFPHGEFDSDTIQFNCSTGVIVPTLDQVGTAALAGLLLLVGVWVGRRRYWATTAGC